MTPLSALLCHTLPPPQPIHCQRFHTCSCWQKVCGGNGIEARGCWGKGPKFTSAATCLKWHLWWWLIAIKDKFCLCIWLCNKSSEWKICYLSQKSFRFVVCLWSCVRILYCGKTHLFAIVHFQMILGITVWTDCSICILFELFQKSLHSPFNAINHFSIMPPLIFYLKFLFLFVVHHFMHSH